MAKEQKKMVDDITSMDEDFAKWYTDICRKAELIEYTSVKGCMVIRPYGYAIWENIQKTLDGMFKETGHENVCMPMFIPESLLQKEKDHVEGFAPECAWVTMGGNEELEERLCVRPTSETLFCEHFKQIVHSYRDLPKLYNQWVSVVRWEKTTRPFLRSREFLWQEGHTLHETADEAIEETEKMLNVYTEFCQKYLAMPVVQGMKTESAAHTPAKRLTKSPKRLKRTATALSRQCGAAARNAKARLRSLRELARAAFRLSRSMLQTPASAAASPQSTCFIGARLIDNPLPAACKTGRQAF